MNEELKIFWGVLKQNIENGKANYPRMWVPVLTISMAVAVAVKVGTVLLEMLLLYCGWNWFIAPMGLPEVGYWQVFGLMLLRIVVKAMGAEDSYSKEYFRGIIVLLMMYATYKWGM